MAKSKQPAIIFLDANKLDFYGSNLSSVVRLVFPKNVVSDMEVINEQNLGIFIKSFVDTYKIIPSNILIVLSPSVLFEKNFQGVLDKQQETEVLKKFLDNVPFTNTNTKVEKTQNGYKIIATNRNLYQDVKNAFEKLGFHIDSVVSYYVFNLSPSVNGLDVKTALSLLKKIGIAKQNSLLSDDASKASTSLESNTPNTGKKQKIRLYLLAAIFGMLFVVLIAVWFMTNSKPSPKIQNVQLSPIPVTPTAPATPKAVEASVSASLIGALRVQILSPSNKIVVSENIEKDLLASGFKTVEKGRSNVTSSSTIIIFSNTLPASIREIISSSVGKEINDYKVQETVQPQYDVVITIGNNP